MYLGTEFSDQKVYTDLLSYLCRIRVKLEEGGRWRVVILDLSNRERYKRQK